MEQNYGQQPVTPPKNWLVESILVTIFCCLPFGIAGIVFAAQVNSKFAGGDYVGAEQASKEAARWTKIGFYLGIAQVVLGILWVVFWGGFAIMSSRYHF
ncbi:MAG: CD225/dispanin family protein [Panacibacter sp.]